VQPLLQWKSNKYYIISTCVCTLSQLARKVHVLYYIGMWPFWLYSIVPHSGSTVSCHILALWYRATFWFYSIVPHSGSTVLCHILVLLYCATFWTYGIVPHSGSTVLCHILALQYCATFSHKQHNSQKNKLNIKCVL
jgi:hypothetical protein